ncbi:MAG: hypothetical protein KF861_05115 [Planctomycetaceae bacterium]|nr:hypothetical protein [Planctomycetaceae bacterium]
MLPPEKGNADAALVGNSSLVDVCTLMYTHMGCGVYKEFPGPKLRHGPI